MRLPGNILFLTAIAFFYSFNTLAQETENSDYYQPLQDVFQTELVYPQEKSEVQLSFTPAFEKNDHFKLLSLPLSLEYGLTDRWQVGLGWTAFQQRFPVLGRSVSGIGNLELSTQYSFMNIDNTNLHAAIGFEVGVPLANEDKGFGESDWEFEPYISLAHDFPSLNHSQLFAQAGIGFEQINPDEESEGNELLFRGGFFIPVNKVIFTSELSWCGNKWDKGDESQFYFTPGFIVDLPGSWETGLGIPIGLNNESNSFMILAILTFEFNLTQEKD